MLLGTKEIAFQIILALSVRFSLILKRIWCGLIFAQICDIEGLNEATFTSQLRASGKSELKKA